MNETFMKEKPILPLLTSMALPMVISMMVNALCRQSVRRQNQ